MVRANLEIYLVEGHRSICGGVDLFEKTGPTSDGMVLPLLIIGFLISEDLVQAKLFKDLQVQHLLGGPREKSSSAVAF